jgi:acyl-CoA thioesterase-1
LIITLDAVTKIISLIKTCLLETRLSRTVLLQTLILLFSPSAYTQQSTLLVYGDSISAAYGMAQEQGWVHLLARQLDATAAEYNVDRG